ncbi:unnamed protein product [marine sediment metagenome]|uniref:Phosphate transport regulator n=1 Tax=marine sediment metagenome TaxID=412755 RepID=X1LCK1_9ZZZZ
MPTEGKFFDLFNQHAELAVKCAKEMVALMTNFDDLEIRVHAIEAVEKEADKVTHNAIELLHKTFITPLDRDDIHQLITRMDDILDLLEDAAQTISLAHRSRHVQLMEHEHGRQVEEGGHGHGGLRTQHARGDHGGDRVGGVVETVHEVEQQRQDDQQRENM